jgi:hypothetical protein
MPAKTIRGEPSSSGTVPRARPGPANWLHALRIYLAVSAGANLFWETAQLPLYTIWRTGSAREIAFAVLHCTGGDLLIAAATLALALVAFGDPAWPIGGFGRVRLATILSGTAYTILSEWLNVSVRGSWSYSELMPVLPPLGTGLAPLAQWFVVPALALGTARAAVRPDVA